MAPAGWVILGEGIRAGFGVEDLKTGLLKENKTKLNKERQGLTSLLFGIKVRSPFCLSLQSSPWR